MSPSPTSSALPRSRPTPTLTPGFSLSLPSSSSYPHPQPRISLRSPSPTPISASSPSSPSRRGSPPFGKMAAPFPRAVKRLLAVVALLLLSLLFVDLSRSPSPQPNDMGVWDASSYSDRHLSRTVSLRRNLPFFSLFSSGSRHHHPPPSSFPQPPPRQPRPLPRVNTASNVSIPFNPAPGSSRVALDGQPDTYALSPLPTLEEAFRHLEPELRAVKETYMNIPREHELWSPIFAPYVNDELRARYRHLIELWDDDRGEWVRREGRWYLVTVCRQVAGMLADWFATWTVLADFLGPESLVISLLEGDSADGSGEILSTVMRKHLLYLGVPPQNIHIRTNLPPLDWESTHRIAQLAQMRNAGMQPFYDSVENNRGLSPDGKPWTGVIFYNDVYLSGVHFLELMHQHEMQDADMTCGWDHAGRWFYDGWVGRDMSGDLYTPFPVKEEDKDLPQKLFLSHPSTKTRFDHLVPFQVFAGWNGIAVMSPLPFLPPYNVRFRRGAEAQPEEGLTAHDIECQQSESSFISWDFWKYGFGRIQVVPGVHACYGKEDAMMRGWVEWPTPPPDGSVSEEIAWQPHPPSRIRCHDWPDKPGKGYWAWDTVRWVPPPELEYPDS